MVDDPLAYLGIKFLKKTQTYFLGDVIEGVVELNAECEQPLTAFISLIFRGESLACWYDDGDEDEERKEPSWKQNPTVSTTSSTKLNASCTIRSHRTHWMEKIVILSDDDSKRNLCGGRHLFDFSVRVPEHDLPSSFESKFGAIKYWVKVCVDIVEGDKHYNCQQPFTVLQEIDINQRLYQATLSDSVDRDVSWFCCGFGGIRLTAQLDRSAYCSGEAIAISCRGKNLTNQDMGGLKARLIQSVLYCSENKTKDYEIILCAIGGNQIGKGQTKVWDNQLLWIPPIPPTNQLSGNILVQYKVQITMAVPKSRDLQIEFPVTIGTTGWHNNNKSGDDAMGDVTAEKCTIGCECFNRSSKRFQFPMLPFIPSTMFVTKYVYQQSSLDNRTRYTKGRRDERERQPLLGGR